MSIVLSKALPAQAKHKERSAKKAELKSLARQIGLTGMRVLAPLIRDEI